MKFWLWWIPLFLILFVAVNAIGWLGVLDQDIDVLLCRFVVWIRSW